MFKHMSLAPVLIFVYNRLDHTKKTLEALSKNILAEKTDLFIFCDNYKKEKDIETVKKVRNLIDEFSVNAVFSNVTVKKAEKNKGLANSIIAGVSEIINQYGKVIVLEDDLITSKNFLKYMNQALDFYEHQTNIWSISGYTFPMKTLETYPHDVYMSGRGSSWGWASWKDRWETIDWSVSDYKNFEFNYIKRHHFSKWGADMPFMLDRQMQGKINSWAIRWCYAQYKQNKFTIYPKESYIQNIGTDGSGTHFSKSNTHYDTFLRTDDIECKFEILDIDKRIRKEFQKKYLNRMGILKSNIKKIIDKIT